MAAKKILPVVLGAVAVVAGVMFWINSGYEETDDALIAAHVIPLMPKVSGYVAAVHVVDNQSVKKGDLLVEIDPEDFQVNVEKAAASLAAIEAKMTGSTATLKTTQTTSSTLMATARAAVTAAETNIERTANEVKRLRQIGSEFVSKKQMDAALSAEGDARARLEDAHAQLKAAATAPNEVRVAESGVTELQARQMEAKAILEAAQNDLKNTKIYAAEDGMISNKTVEPGAYLKPGDRMLAVVTHERWVVANFKETQLDGIKVGQSVDIHVDAYPDVELKGRVDSIQRGTGGAFSIFPSQNATGNFVKIVQRVPVKIVFDGDVPADIVLGPGMSVIPKVKIK